MANPNGLIPDPVPDHPLLNGRPEVGRGESTIVVDGRVVDGQETVFKILSSPADYAYYTAEDRPVGEQQPQRHWHWVVFLQTRSAGSRRTDLG